MRVAIVSPLQESVPPKFYGGTERVVANLCQGLSAAGVDVTLFASGDSRMPDVRLIAVSEEALRLRKTTLVEPEAYNFKMLALLAKHAGEFDVIHNNNSYWMLPFTEMRGTPFVTTFHGRLDFPEILTALSSYPQARFISISNAQRLPAPGLQWIKTVYHGLNTRTFVFHPNPGKYLAFLGRITPEKRVDWAIEIAKRSGVPLKIAAKIEDGRDRDYYDAYIKRQIDGNFIEFVGEISDAEKSDFLGHALALVFPIDCPESFGLVTTEALATGTPVLARPLGAVPEILQDGVTGFHSLDIKVLSKRVEDIPKLDRRACRSWFEDRYSIERMTENYLAAYRQLLGPRRVRAHA